MELVWKTPNSAEVMVVQPIHHPIRRFDIPTFWTPLKLMHICLFHRHFQQISYSAWMTTATPIGSIASLIAFAISSVNLSWIYSTIVSFQLNPILVNDEQTSLSLWPIWTILTPYCWEYIRCWPRNDHHGINSLFSYLSIEWQQMVLAHRIEWNVLHNNHLVVLLLENGLVQNSLLLIQECKQDIPPDLVNNPVYRTASTLQLSWESLTNPHDSHPRQWPAQHSLSKNYKTKYFQDGFVGVCKLLKLLLVLHVLAGVRSIV